MCRIESSPDKHKSTLVGNKLVMSAVPNGQFDQKFLCAISDLLSSLGSFVKEGVTNMLLGSADLHVTLNKVSFPGYYIFLSSFGNKKFFVATIVQLKVAKRVFLWE